MTHENSVAFSMHPAAGASRILTHGALNPRDRVDQILCRFRFIRGDGFD